MKPLPLPPISDIGVAKDSVDIFINGQTASIDKKVFSLFSMLCHHDNFKWWKDIETGELLDRNVGEMIALMHSELSEALEGYRKSLPDHHLPFRSNFEVELADLLIRVFDLAGAMGLDLDGAFWEKRAYNLTRADHSIAARRAEGGKKF